MKQILLFYLVMICILNHLYSQTLELTTPEGQILNYGDTITVNGSSQSSELIAHVYVKNISNSTVSVTCTKSYISIIPGSSNTFCWANNCYPPNIFTSTGSKTLAPQEVATDFSGDYYPNGNAGISFIRYTFNVYHGDSAWIIVKYDATGSSVLTNSYTYFSKPYPNPASEYVFISLSKLSNHQKATIDIFDITGKKIHSIQMPTNNSNNVNIPVSHLKNGVYILQYIVNNKLIRTDKLIIQH